MNRVASSLAPLMLCGCAAFGHPAPDQVAPRHVAGHYYLGDGLGTIISVHLSEDGTYESTWYGCLGEYGTSAGRWSLDEGLVTFEASAETEMMVGYLRQARVKSSWPNYKLVPTAGTANGGEVLYPFFPEPQ
jgi:hypothetical protein